MNTTNRHLSRAGVSSIDRSGKSVRLLKWLVLIVLLVLVLLAIFLPDRGLATPPGAAAQRSTQPNPTPPRTETPPGAWQA